MFLDRVLPRPWRLLLAVTQHATPLDRTRRHEGDVKDSVAAETLSNLSQAEFIQHPNHMQQQQQYHQYRHVADPRPSSYPCGPLNLGQQPQQGHIPRRHSQDDDGQGMDDNDGQGGTGNRMNGGEGADGDKLSSSSGKTGGRRSGCSATMSNDEWTRQRKDNHVRVQFYR